MSIVWEDPPKAARGPHAFERSALRKEVDDMLYQIQEKPQQWARLYDFDDREEAEKRAAFVRSATGKGWNVAVRQTDYGWSIFARTKPDKALGI
jgi:hypothetical protein